MIDCCRLVFHRWQAQDVHRACVKLLPRESNPLLGSLSSAGACRPDSLGNKAFAASDLGSLNSSGVLKIRGISLCLLLVRLMFSAFNPI